MISWLKGQIIKKWHLSSKRGVVINIGGIGYEVQLLSKQVDINDQTDLVELWIHQINREDSTSLYGFKQINQRDIFRKIISVNGIGPQIAMALLEDHEVTQLVSAIENNDLNLLTKSQGIGKRIAERLVVELKNKLQLFKVNEDIDINIQGQTISNQFTKYMEEIESILTSLGYMNNEIKDSIEFITNEKTNHSLINALSTDARKELMDEHLKEILIRLSQKST